MNNECEINIYNRHICPGCRLEKCFAIGMQIELIRCPISQRRRRTSERISSTQSLTTISNILTTINERETFVQVFFIKTKIEKTSKFFQFQFSFQH